MADRTDKEAKKSSADSSADRSGRRTGERKGGGGQGSGGYKPRIVLPSNMEPTYYIGGGNGNAIIESTMNELGWRRITDKSDDSFKLRWCETKAAINYNTFREGEQMVNHIPNCNLLTNKMGLLTSLQEYNRLCDKTKKKETKLNFIPETYRLDDGNDRQTFLDTYKVEDVWICKPTGRNQGKGIFLVRSIDDVKQALGVEDSKSSSERDSGDTKASPEAGAGEEQGAQKEKTEDTEQQQQQQQQQQEEIKELRKMPPPSKKMNRIVQRYINNPLLLNGKKFDIRCYMLIANTVPFLVLYTQGYIRLSIHDYDNDDTNLIAHLTNQFIQKKDPTYQEVKDDTTWSMDKFNAYINDNLAADKGIPADWAQTVLVSRIKQIMMYCYNSVKSKLETKVGYFDLYGLDFMIDEDMKVWLIEVNINPCLATNCSALKERVPGVVKEAIHLAIECFDKSRKGRALLPLQSLKNFTVLHNGCTKQARGSQSSGAQTAKSKQPATGAITTSRTEKTGQQQQPRSPSQQQQQQQQQSAKSSVPVRRSRSLSPVKESQGAKENPKQTSPSSSNNKNNNKSSIKPVRIAPGATPTYTQQQQSTNKQSAEKSPSSGTRTSSNQSEKQRASGGTSADRSAKPVPRAKTSAGGSSGGAGTKQSQNGGSRDTSSDTKTKTASDNNNKEQGKEARTSKGTSNSSSSSAKPTTTTTMTNGDRKKSSSSPYAAPVHLKLSHESGKKKSQGSISEQEKPNRGS